MTYGEFVDDILVALGFIHDDSLFYRDNILQNTVYQESLLTTQTLSRDLGIRGDGKGATYNSRTVVVPVTYNETPTDANWSYLYFDLPSQVYSLPFDGGLATIAYHRPSLPVNCPPSWAGAKFTQTTFGALTGLYGSPYQKPSESQPYYVRYKAGNEDRVALFGMSPLVEKLLIQVYYAPKYTGISYSDEMPIDPHKLNDLKRLVLTMSAWPLGIPQDRLKNDGRDLEPSEVVNIRPLVSVNDPILSSNTEQ